MQAKALEVIRDLEVLHRMALSMEVFCNKDFRAVFITTARVGGSRSGRRSRGCLPV